MRIEPPEFALVLLGGGSGTGKSSFAARHFLPTEVVSSDQAATGDAFDVLQYLVEKRLKGRRLTVVDATNVQPESRKSLIALGRKWHALAVAIVFELPEAVAIERTKLWFDKRGETGPFDIIGDIHGCADELEESLGRLGYKVCWNGKDVTVTPPPERRAVFLGDFVDREPRSLDVLRIAKAMVEAGTALAVVGNHDDKLKRHLSGKQVKIAHGVAQTIEQFAGEQPSEPTGGMGAWLGRRRRSPTTQPRVSPWS